MAFIRLTIVINQFAEKKNNFFKNEKTFHVLSDPSFRGKEISKPVDSKNGAFSKK